MTDPSPSKEAMEVAKKIGIFCTDDMDPSMHSTRCICDKTELEIAIALDTFAAQRTAEVEKRFREKDAEWMDALGMSHVSIRDPKRVADLVKAKAESQLASLSERVERMREALERIREMYAGSEIGEPVYASEAYAVQIVKDMYREAVAALSPAPSRGGGEDE